MSVLKKSLAALGVCAVAASAISFEPVTAGATESAKKLYNFLAVNYGVKTITGVQTGDIADTYDALPDVISFEEHSGKKPVLVGLDFLFVYGIKASDSWYKAYTQSAVDAAKDIWAKGGIPAFSWHWKDPSHKQDAFYTKSGNANEFTEFDFTQGFTDPSCNTNCLWNTNSETYKQIVEDIAEIAVYFKQLQDAGVAAVFRPLHEASGAWFWWGSHGGAAYQALYQLVYDQMVNINGIKNLVWAWTPQLAKDTDWDPGKDKYDVIGLDVYGANDYSQKFIEAYTDLQTNFAAHNKIFAMTENGPIPDQSVMAENKTVWSWWLPWYHTWNGNFLDQTVESVWKANVNSECVITMDEMPGWDKYTMSTTKVADCIVGYKLGDLDTARPVENRIPADTATNRWLYAQLLPADTARGNIIIKENADLSKNSKMSVTVFNGSKTNGFWFTVAFLGNKDADWGWAQPEGCWINAGDSTVCELDLTTTAKDQVVLTGADYTNFMSNIAKVYIEVSVPEFNGYVFFDDIKADGVTFENFDEMTTVKAEQAQNLKAGLVGKGKEMSIQSKAHVQKMAQISFAGRSLSLTLSKASQTSVQLFNLQGHLVKNFANGSLAAGTHQFTLQGIPQGAYIIRVKNAAGISAKKILVK